MICSIASNVEESTIQAIRDLEKGVGKILLAYKCHDVKPAALSAEDLEKVQAAEKALGVSLVAVTEA